MEEERAEEKKAEEKRVEEKREQESSVMDFEFHYSANEHKERNREIERIRNQYMSEEENEPDSRQRQQEDKLEKLKKLDEKAKQPALILSLGLGVSGALLFGLGMSMCLAMDMMAFGIIIGVLGMIPICLAFPAHQYLLKKGKEKYGAEIVKLSQELLGNG